MDDAVGCAVCCWRESGCVIGGAGNGSPVGKRPTGNGGIGLNEIWWMTSERVKVSRSDDSPTL